MYEFTNKNEMSAFWPNVASARELHRRPCSTLGCLIVAPLGCALAFSGSFALAFPFAALSFASKSLAEEAADFPDGFSHELAPFAFRVFHLKEDF